MAVKKKQTPKRLTKKELETKKFQAYTMYLAFEQNNVIAEILNVSERTIGEWAKTDKWKSKRTAGTITRDELINKCLTSLNKILDDFVSGENVANLEDRLAKMAKTIEVLDRKNNVVYNIETFTGFNKYLLQRLPDDANLSADLVKTINKLQNDYVTYRMNG